jgi:hypothetical protein
MKVPWEPLSVTTCAFSWRAKVATIPVPSPTSATLVCSCLRCPLSDADNVDSVFAASQVTTMSPPLAALPNA